VAPDDGVGEIQVFEDCLELPAVMLADLAAEDGGDLLGPADGAIGIQEALSQSVQGSAPMEDEIVAILHLCKEQAMLTPGLLAFGFSKERCEIGQPLLAAGQQILGCEGIGEFLQALGITAPQKRVRALAKINALLAQAIGEPVVLIQTHSRGEREIGANAYFRMGHTGGGFRAWWQKLEGSEEHLDNAHLMRMAGRFSRRLRAFAKARGIPVVECKRGERKHEIA